jgi:NDP-sugar pyrophosphorylase family protein
MQPTLLILAAGMGSRYGGLKQLDPVGPSGETLLDYSIFDALRAGFGRVVFVIRRDFEEEFRERIGKFYEKHVEVGYVYQELDALPAGFSVPEGRTKPWGTGHAIWCARDQVSHPFAAINADDFYGAAAYRTLADFFQRTQEEANRFAMVGYELRRTLSENGSVSRGVCQTAENSDLLSVVEYTNIERHNDQARHVNSDGTDVPFQGDEIVSMNFWGFTPAVFPMLEQRLTEFLSARGNEAKSEFYIPFAVADMIAKNEAKVTALSTDSDWFGVTYREDKAIVMASIERLVQDGAYPASLWSEAGAKTQETTV